MAEDDDVDVLGDYNFDLLNKTDSFDGTPLVSQTSDLLNCDYTIHPQWLLDKPSTNPALWYDTSDLDVSDYDSQAESTILSQQNSITDESGWTEKEKDLLNRGIEIFGKSNLNLSQFIGSRTPAEVKYFLKNFYTDSTVQLSYTSVNEDIIFDNCVEETVITTPVLQEYEIPASIEEVIDAVSTAKTTAVSRKRTNSGKKSSTGDKLDKINYNDVPSGQSLLRSSYNKSKPETPPKGSNNIYNINKMKQNSPKVKFKTKLKLFSNINQRRMHVSHNNKQEKLPGKVKQRKASVRQDIKSPIRQKSPMQEEIPLKKDLRIVTGNGIGVPVCDGEEVVKIIKETETESDTDVDIDIEDDEVSSQEKVENVSEKTQISLKQEENHNEVENASKVNLSENESKLNNFGNFNKILPKKGPQLEDLSENVVKELLSMEEPVSEIVLNRSDVTDIEKFLFFEFFEDRPTKTPARYLHIRNHILETWRRTKPKYLRKTTIRNGLKHAGDVNLIGRIHSYLEQIAAINFGCEQTSYYRPLLELAAVPVHTPKEKMIIQKSESIPRQRIKKKYVNDGEGGYTLTHDEKGEIINTTVVNEEPAVKQKTYLKKPTIRLVYCRPFTEEYPQKYTISLDISTLILMDLHAHMHLTEVMGLIGGYWNESGKQLIIKRYIACRNIGSSLTHCDMCPISQAKAAEILHDENLDILGWYHSHPTFAPEPSQQDIETQLSVQQWIGSKIPCIGFILSPFSLHGALIASPYRCMIVHKVKTTKQENVENDEEQLVPYKFKVDLLIERLKVGDLLEKAKHVLLHNLQEELKSRVDFNKSYFQDNSITYLDKYIYSVKMHLAKCSGINKMTCDAIIDGLTRLCKHYSTIKK